MRILHTSDIHLVEVGDRRWEAFQAILRLARSERAAVLVISGDLMSTNADPHELKLALAEQLQAQEYATVILPGNDDARLFADSTFYGHNVSVLGEHKPYIDVDQVRFHGLVFERVVGTRVMEKIFEAAGRCRQDASNILLYHGELLDLASQKKSFGAEEHAGYMATRMTYFDDMGFDYVLAGHLHSAFEVQEYRGGYFAYPGSPVSVTENEVGIRKVNFFSLGEPPRERNIDTLHHKRIRITLTPFSLQNPTDTVRRGLNDLHPYAQVHLTVDGFVDLKRLQLSSSDVTSAIHHVLPPQVETTVMAWTDISFIWENELFIRFLERLEATSYPESKKTALREFMLQSVVEAVSAD